MPRAKSSSIKPGIYDAETQTIKDVHSAYCHLYCVKRRNYVPLLTAGLLMTTFLLGMAFMKIEYLQGGAQASTSTTSTTNALPATVHFDAYAKKVGLNVDKFDKCVLSGKYQKTVQADSDAGTKAGVNGTPTMFIDGIPVEGAVPYAQIKQVIDQELASAKLPVNSNRNLSILNMLAGVAYAEGGAVGNSAPTDQSSPTPATRVSVENGHLPIVGSKDAKVTVVEFSDFECPFCKQLQDQSFPSIKKDYIDTGKIKFFYRHFPLPFHPNAMGAAMASECANEQGKFWDYHDELFANQNVWQGDIPVAIKK